MPVIKPKQKTGQRLLSDFRYRLGKLFTNPNNKTPEGNMIARCTRSFHRVKSPCYKVFYNNFGVDMSKTKVEGTFLYDELSDKQLAEGSDILTNAYDAIVQFWKERPDEMNTVVFVDIFKKAVEAGPNGEVGSLKDYDKAPYEVTSKKTPDAEDLFVSDVEFSELDEEDFFGEQSSPDKIAELRALLIVKHFNKYRAGKLLKEINREGLYKRDFPSFSSFQKTLPIGKTSCYRMIDVYVVSENLKIHSTSDRMPLPAIYFVLLSMLKKPEMQGKAWDHVVEHFYKQGKTPTKRDVKEAVDKFKSADKIKVAEVKKTQECMDALDAPDTKTVIVPVEASSPVPELSELEFEKEAKRLRKEGLTLREISEKLGSNKSKIYKITKGILKIPELDQAEAERLEDAKKDPDVSIVSIRNAYAGERDGETLYFADKRLATEFGSGRFRKVSVMLAENKYYKLDDPIEFLTSKDWSARQKLDKEKEAEKIEMQRKETAAKLKAAKEAEDLRIFIEEQELIRIGRELKATGTTIDEVRDLKRAKEQASELIKKGPEEDKGVQLGRPKVEFDIDEAVRLKLSGLSWRKLASEMGVSAETLRLKVTPLLQEVEGECEEFDIPMEITVLDAPSEEPPKTLWKRFTGWLK